jgi:pyruvate dehydrogenase E2 component (dihydrolipoamide acetyltransferase)
MAALREAVNRARRGALRSSELGGASVTVTNLGQQGALKVFGVIHPPQVALVGFGRIGEEAWAENGLLGARPVVRATLAADHRASDGQRGSRFLAALAGRLADPEGL